MKRGLLLLVLAALAACAGPRPCTRTLCPSRVSGSYRVTGWNGTVLVNADLPKPPVMSHSRVEVADGEIEFVTGENVKVLAPVGTSFAFQVSTDAVPSLIVSSGALTVQTSSGAITTVAGGSSLALPKAK